MNKVNQEYIQNFITCEITYCINAFDIEKITKKIYGVSIEMLESPNDTTHAFDINEEIYEGDEETLKKAIEDKSLEYWKYQVVLNDLCRKKLISSGKYLVWMSW